MTHEDLGERAVAAGVEWRDGMRDVATGLRWSQGGDNPCVVERMARRGEAVPDILDVPTLFAVVEQLRARPMPDAARTALAERLALWFAGVVSTETLAERVVATLESTHG